MTYLLRDDDIAEIESAFIADIYADIDCIRANNIENPLKVAKLLCISQCAHRLPQALTILHIRPHTPTGQVANILLDIYIGLDHDPDDHQIALARALFGILNIS